MLILFIFFVTCTAGDPMNQEDTCNNYVRSENELILPLIAIIKPMKISRLKCYC